jgi:hypothetical protein
LNHQYGKDIDDHGDIIRFNYAHLTGFEKHCGSKTTIRFAGWPAFLGGKPEAHPKGVKNMDYHIYDKIRNMNIIVYYRPPAIRLKILQKVKALAKNRNKVHLIRLEDLKLFHTILTSFGLKESKTNLQSGTVLMLLISDLGIVPDLYGFDLKYCPDNYYYYWDIENKKCHKMSVSHDYNDEFYIPNRLAELGIIKMWTKHKY